MDVNCVTPDERVGNVSTTENDNVKRKRETLTPAEWSDARNGCEARGTAVIQAALDAVAHERAGMPGHDLIDGTWGVLSEVLWRPLLDPLSEWQLGPTPLAMMGTLSRVHPRLREMARQIYEGLARRLGLPGFGLDAFPTRPMSKQFEKCYLFKFEPEQRAVYETHRWEFRLQMEVCRYHFVREFASETDGDVVISGSWALNRCQLQLMGAERTGWIANDLDVFVRYRGTEEHAELMRRMDAWWLERGFNTCFAPCCWGEDDSNDDEEDETRIDYFGHAGKGHPVSRNALVTFLEKCQNSLGLTNGLDAAARVDMIETRKAMVEEADTKFPLSELQKELILGQDEFGEARHSVWPHNAPCSILLKMARQGALGQVQRQWRFVAKNGPRKIGLAVVSDKWWDSHEQTVDEMRECKTARLADDPGEEEEECEQFRCLESDLTPLMVYDRSDLSLSYYERGLIDCDTPGPRRSRSDILKANEKLGSFMKTYRRIMVFRALRIARRSTLEGGDMCFNIVPLSPPETCPDLPMADVVGTFDIVNAKVRCLVDKGKNEFVFRGDGVDLLEAHNASEERSAKVPLRLGETIFASGKLDAQLARVHKYVLRDYALIAKASDYDGGPWVHPKRG